ncbi:Uncharacterised protein [Budvicia aquatica]|uniref:Uncharacterized protein n=1 Tax=Budvicia aquatica TaxID=82979 RepID=A0A484ZKC7_9GAMM|nr:Uncharacterised protein [Budvicia aquatica]
MNQTATEKTGTAGVNGSMASHPVMRLTPLPVRYLRY